MKLKLKLKSSEAYIIRHALQARVTTLKTVTKNGGPKELADQIAATGALLKRVSNLVEAV